MLHYFKAFKNKSKMFFKKKNNNAIAPYTLLHNSMAQHIPLVW